MPAILEILRQRLSPDLDVTPELEETCEALDRSHPDLLSHILESESWLEGRNADDPVLSRNRERAEALAPKASGCCWFRDPVSGVIPLSEDSEWMIKSLDPAIWLPFFQAFPTLAPEILAGPLTDVVALHVSDDYRGRAFLRRMKELHRESPLPFRLRRGNDTWLCFSCPRRDEGWSLRQTSPGETVLLPGAESEAGVLGFGSLIPVPNTVSFRPPDGSGLPACEHTVQLENSDGVKPDRGPVPNYIMEAFAHDAESDARRTARLYRRGPGSRERIRELVNNAVKALTAFPEGHLRDRACREVCRPILREMNQVLGEDGLRALSARLVKDAGISPAGARGHVDEYLQGCAAGQTLLLLLVLGHAGALS